MDFTVKRNLKVHSLYSLLILTPKGTNKLPQMLPGQFVQVSVPDSPHTFLRRPISVNFADYEAGELWLLIRKAGEGTEHLIALPEGADLNLLLPLGNGFSTDIPAGTRVLLVGGGVGVAPLLYLGHKLKEGGVKPEFLLGARSATDLLELDEFNVVGKVYLSTEEDRKSVV